MRLVSSEEHLLLISLSANQPWVQLVGTWFQAVCTILLLFPDYYFHDTEHASQENAQGKLRLQFPSDYLNLFLLRANQKSAASRENP